MSLRHRHGGGHLAALVAGLALFTQQGQRSAHRAARRVRGTDRRRLLRLERRRMTAQPDETYQRVDGKQAYRYGNAWVHPGRQPGEPRDEADAIYKSEAERRTARTMRHKRRRLEQQAIDRAMARLRLVLPGA